MKKNIFLLFGMIEVRKLGQSKNKKEVFYSIFYFVSLVDEESLLFQLEIMKKMQNPFAISFRFLLLLIISDWMNGTQYKNIITIYANTKKKIEIKRQNIVFLLSLRFFLRRSRHRAVSIFIIFFLFVSMFK